MELLFKTLRKIFWTNLLLALIVAIPYTILTSIREYLYIQDNWGSRIYKKPNFWEVLNCHCRCRLEDIASFYHQVIKNGASRVVIFCFGYAFKFPRPDKYKCFLWGLLANLQEAKYYKTTKDCRLCPVVFSAPLGFCVIMKKCGYVSKEDYSTQDLLNFAINGDFKIPAEIKHDSFGILKGKLVAIDYG